MMCYFEKRSSILGAWTTDNEYGEKGGAGFYKLSLQSL